MRPSIVIAAVVVLGFAAGGGYYGLEVFPQQRFRAGLDQALATLPPGTTATYKTARYSVLMHQAIVTGLSVHGQIPGDTPQPFEVTIDSIETTSPNLEFPDLWARAVANPAAFAPDTAIPVADAITLKGAIVHSAAINLTEASVQVAKLRLYPWALLHDGMPSWQEIQASVKPRSQPPELADLRPILRAEAAAMLGIAYDGYAVGAANITESLPGIEAAYDIREVTGGRFDRGIMRGAALRGITLHDNVVGALSIDHVAMSTIDVREPMTRLILGDPLSPAMLNRISIGRIEYAGITAQPPGQPAIHITGFSMGPVTFTDGMPVSGELGWTDIRVSKLQLPDPRAWDAFNQLGLETITVSFALAYDWDVSHQHVSIHDTMLKVDELGTLTLSADFSNIVPGAAAMDQGSLAHLRLRLVDASLVDRLLRMGATSSGADPAAYRALIVAMLRQQPTAGGGNGTVMAAAAHAAGEFIASPQSLTVEFSPPTPIPFVALRNAAMAPVNLATMPGLTVSANQP
jgi:hypothetical protein